MSFSKRDFQKICKAKALYYANTEKCVRKQIPLVTKNMGISELQASQPIDYSLQSFSQNEIFDEDADNIAAQIPSPATVGTKSGVFENLSGAIERSF